MTEAQKYTRDELRLVGAQFVDFLGYGLTDEDKPIKARKSMSDADLELHIIEEMKKAAALGFTGKDGKQRDVDTVPDSLLHFMFVKKVIELPEDEDDEEPLGDVAATPDTPDTNDEEEPLGDTPEAPTPTVTPTQPDTSDLEAELAALQAELASTEGAGEVAVPEPEPAPADTAAETTDAPLAVDAKVETLAALQGTTPDEALGTYAPVTVQNIEAAIIAIAKMLSQGKILVISAHEIGEVPVTGHKTATLDVPPKAAAPIVPAVLPKQVAVATADAKDVMRTRLYKTGDLGTTEARQAFIKANGIPFKRKTLTAEDATGKQCAFAILAWVKQRAKNAVVNAQNDGVAVDA